MTENVTPIGLPLAAQPIDAVDAESLEELFESLHDQVSDAETELFGAMTETARVAYVLFVNNAMDHPYAELYDTLRRHFGFRTVRRWLEVELHPLTDVARGEFNAAIEATGDIVAAAQSIEPRTLLDSVLYYSFLEDAFIDGVPPLKRKEEWDPRGIESGHNSFGATDPGAYVDSDGDEYYWDGFYWTGQGEDPVPPVRRMVAGPASEE